MTTLIKIKRGSIKKNPNAGNEISHIPMSWDIRFDTNMPYKKLPKWIKDCCLEQELSMKKLKI